MSRKGRVWRAESRVRAKRVTALLTLAAALCLLVGFAGCGGDDDKSGSKPEKVTKLRVAFAPGFGTLPVEVARERGCFRENNLDIKFTEGFELAAWAASLGKQFDIAMEVPPVFLAAVSKGAPYVAISGVQVTDADHVDSVLVAADKDIHGVADLRGKKVGVPTLVGTNAESLRYLLKDKGIDPDEVKLQEVPFATQVDQMKAGRVAAVVSTPPYHTQAVKAGYRVLGDVLVQAVEAATDGKVHTAISALFMATKSWANENPEIVSTWKRCLQEGIDFIGSNESEARVMLQKWLKVPKSVAQTSSLPGFAVDITAAGLQPQIDISESMGSVKNVPPASKIVLE